MAAAPPVALAVVVVAASAILTAGATMVEFLLKILPDVMVAAQVTEMLDVEVVVFMITTPSVAVAAVQAVLDI